MNEIIEKLVCERVRLTSQEVLSERNFYAIGTTAKWETYVDQRLRGMVIRLTAQVPAVLSERIIVHEKWPIDWWQAVKARWFPGWLLRRFPVKWRRIDIDRAIYSAVCPHVDLSGIEDKGTHLTWLLSKQASSVRKGNHVC